MAGINLADVPHAATRYAKLVQDRQPFLDRARDCALVTIPSLMPPQGFGASQKLSTPYQALGARGVRNLASKLLLTLFPKTVPFFNYEMDDLTLESLGGKRSEVEMLLSRRERAVVSELDRCVFHPAAFNVLLQLLVAGSALLYMPKKEGRARAFKLDQFVTRRDNAGNLLEIVVEEAIDYASLPDKVAAELAKDPKYQGDANNLDLSDRPLTLYTHIFWDTGTNRWIVYQEAEGIRFEDGQGSYKDEDLEWRVVHLQLLPGESYGRGFVEEYLGDLDSLEALSEALVEGTAASAKVVFFVNPAGSTSLRVVAESKTGDVRSGNAEDITVMQVQKQADLQVAKAQAEEIATRLSYAFMMHSAIQRSGERVTAEEIRYMASELDMALGGAYTLLAADFQLPLVPILERRMEARIGKDKVAPLPPDMARPVVVTGLQAIGRGQDQANLRAFLTDVIQVLTPQVALKYLNPRDFMMRAAASYDIDTNGLIPSEEEIAQREQQEQMMAMAQQLGPDAIRAGGGMAQSAMQQQAPQQ